MAIIVNLCISFLLLQIISALEKETYCYSLSRVLPCKDSPYRSIDGSCNNLKHPSWGKAFWPYQRLLPNTYADGVHKLSRQKSGTPYPSARKVSNVCFKPGNMHSETFSLIHMQMGQIITHDMALADGTQAFEGNVPPPGCCGSDFQYGALSNTSTCADIDIPPGDPDYGKAGYKCMQFARATTTKAYGCALFEKAEETISRVTSYLDLSIVYGSDDKKMRELRSFKDGKLKTEIRNGQEWPPNVLVPSLLCLRATRPDAKCYNGGDVRLNQNPQLTTLQIIFLRQHNKLAVAIKALNPNFSDEKIYQVARKINIGLYQNIIYKEVLPGYIGLKAMIRYGLYYPNATGCVNDYDGTIDASTYQEFATGGWRKPHSTVSGRLELYGAKRELTEYVDLGDVIDSGDTQERNSKVNLNTFARGLTKQSAYLSDPFYTHVLKYQFNKDNKTGYGIDLVSYDIQRTRDCGLPTYCEVVEYFNRTCPKTWEEMSEVMPKESVEKLQSLYELVKDVELYTAGVLETNVADSLAGPTFQAIWLIQFLRSRKGDRYFFENCEKHGFNTAQLQSMRKVSLARIMCDNTDMNECQARVMELPGDDNPLVNCTDLPYLDITLWRSESKETYLSNSYLQSVLKIFTKIKDFFHSSP